MTTIVAVRKNQRTCIVSDSLVTYGERRKEAYEKLLAPAPKLLRINNAVIGFSGANVWEHCLEKFIVSSKAGIDSCQPLVLRSLFSNFLERLKERWSFSSISGERFTSFSECQIVIARPDSLFEVTIEGCVIENKNIIAIGNGRPFAYGAIQALNPFIEDSAKLAMAGMGAAAAWDPSTSGPFFGWHISESGKFTEFGLTQ